MKDEPMKIVFAPGCFDDFEGTQEELDALIAEIHTIFNNGSIMENATPVDYDKLEETDPDLYRKIERFDNDNKGRKVH